MKKSFEVQLPSPCEQPWDEMRGEGGVRFCDRCQKHVHDLSSMTEREARRLLEESDWQVCVSYEAEEIGKPIFSPEPPSKWARQLDGAMRLAAAAALVVPMLAGCAEKEVDVDPSAQAPIQIDERGASLTQTSPTTPLDVKPGAGRSPDFEPNTRPSHEEVGEKDSDIECIEGPDTEDVADEPRLEEATPAHTTPKETRRKRHGGAPRRITDDGHQWRTTAPDPPHR